MTIKKFIFSLSSVLVVASAFGAAPQFDVALEPNERLISVLSTNDMHGAIESKTGGMAFFGGVVDSIRSTVAAQYGNHAGVVLVDAGDQFQGTLLSNFSEGQLMFALMSEIGYDAVLPGNHDFDFGPIGWLDDKVTEETVDKNPRGALDRIVVQARFPLVSANIYFRNSIVSKNGQSLDVRSAGCTQINSRSRIDWDKAVRPAFVKPYVIKDVADLRVAIIAVDSAQTPMSTRIENVSDLCFRDEADTYLDIRRELQGKADVFLLVMHEGNIMNNRSATTIVERILDGGAVEFGDSVVQAVVTAHTHATYTSYVRGVPMIQSGSGLQTYGRIDLVFDRDSGKTVPAKLRAAAGNKIVEVEGQSIVARLEKIIEDAKVEVEHLSSRVLGVAEAEIRRDWVKESALSDVMTDELRGLSGADVALLNTGGLRSNIQAGEFRYSDLFMVFPFNNRGVIIKDMPVDRLLSLLKKSATTCGAYGALMQSGLKVRFERSCGVARAIDPHARLLRVETLTGEVLLDVEQGISPDPARRLSVATVDFLATGSSDYNDFAGLTVTADMGNLREIIANSYLAKPAKLSAAALDGRWLETAPDQPGVQK